jgi:hypothetical protein
MNPADAVFAVPSEFLRSFSLHLIQSLQSGAVKAAGV